MGLEAEKKKLARATMNLSQLKGDLGRVMTPNIRAIIMNQVAQRQTQIERSIYKINMYEALQPKVTQPLPQKKTPGPKVTTVATKKKTIDKRVHLQVK